MSVEISITDQIVEINEVSNPVEISVAAGSSVQPTWGNINGTLSNQTDLQNALNAKVPYSGATANVDLGEFELKAGQLELDQTPTGTAGVAVTRWNDSVGTIETTLKGGSVVLKHGRDMFERVVNKTGIQLTRAAYQAVRVSDAQGQRLAVQLAQANNDNNSADTIGLVVETIDNNQEGFIYTVGEIDNINTTGSLQGETWVDGDVLYLSPTIAGRITNIKPVAPQHLVIIGYVVYSHANNGKIYVKVMNGWELGELHDVNTTGATNGQVLKYNGTIWVPSSDTGITTLNTLTALSQTFATGTSGTDFNISSATSTHTFNLPSASATNRGLITSVDWTTFNNKENVLTFNSPLSRTTNTISIPQATGSVNGFLSSTDWTTFNNKQNALTNPVTGTGVSGRVAYWSGTNTQTSSANLFWDATNSRLGINVTPETSLHINGSVFIGGVSTIGLQLENALASIPASNVRSIIANTSSGIVVAGALLLQPRTGVAAPILFSTEGSEKMRLTSTGNLLLNSTTDSGQRLQVIGDTLMRGSGNTSATTALLVENSDGTDLLTILNNGYTRYGNAGVSAPRVYSTSVGGGGDVDLAGEFLAINLRSTTTATTTFGLLTINGLTGTATTGTQSVVAINKGFAPTSGTATYTALLYNATINQTGGASGITRGLFINPTLTAAADWRSIEWSNNTGWGLYGIGSAPNYLGGTLTIGGTYGVDRTLFIGRNMTGSITFNGILNEGIIQADVTTSAIYYRSQARGANSLVLTNIVHYYAQQASLGTGSTVTNQFGYHAESNLIGATNNYGFYGNIPSGTGRWNLFMNGTAANFISGDTQIGTGAFTSEKLQVNGTMRVSGASTFSSTLSAVGTLNLQRSGSGADTTIQFRNEVAANRAKIVFGGTNEELGFYAGGGTTEHLRIANSGIATFSNKIITASGLDAIEVGTPSGNNYRANIFLKGTDAGGGTSNGYFGINVFSTSGILDISNTNGISIRTGGAERLGIASTGAATFSSSVTGASFIPTSSTIPTNGMYLSAANTLGFATASTLDMVIDSVGSVGIGTSSVNASAILQTDSTTKGFLPPRMTTTQRNAITTPAAGLIVYDTTDNKHYGYNGTTWNAFY